MMNHVFIIHAHTNAEQLHQLICHLEATNHYFIIHIDRKSSYMVKDPMMIKLSKRENVKIYCELKINWGGANQFFATLFCIKKALANWNNLDYFHLLSGQDYPIAANKEIDTVFESDRSLSYIALADNSNMNLRYDIYYLNDIFDARHSTLLIKILVAGFIKIQFLLLKCGIRIRKRLPLNLYKGSNWWSLNRDAIKYVLSYIDNHPEIIKRFKYTLCCDEIFFHTILYNSPLRKKFLVTDNLRYVDWTSNGRGYPNVLDETDFDKIVSSGKLFCRKVVLPQSEALMTLIDKKIKD